jgi:predicted phosphohydrolase
MTLFGIADLHLDFARPLDRTRYAGRWSDHAAKVERGWRETVGPGDVVVLPGDLSSARNHRDLQPDLAWLDRLPGLKVMGPGNHDRWWNDVSKIRPMLRRSLRAVDGDAIREWGIVFCGARGAAIASEDASEEAREAESRALRRLDSALEAAAAIRLPGDPLVVLWHYPPFDANRRPGPCVERVREAGATHVVYGHLHNQGQWAAAVQGLVGGIRYACVAADAVGFRPPAIDRFDRGDARD